VFKRKILIAIILLPLVIVMGVLSIWFNFLHTSSILDPQGVKYTVREGASFQSVIDDLSAQQIIKHPYLFRLLIKSKHPAHGLKAGEYLFTRGATPPKILEQILTGTGLVQHPFTIIAGWNFKQVREALEKLESLQHTVTKMSDHDIMVKLGQSNLNPEGEFFPDTYYYTTDSLDIKLLKRAFNAMQNKLNLAWQMRDTGLSYTTPYQALIVASLIEKEAHFDSERPVVSGVIMNRLDKNMLLQIDATIIYGLGANYNGTIYKKDLRKQSPYNTYLNKGLPPTPIAMPGLPSILAAVHPEKNEYIYYVARGDGYHQFSKSFREHAKAIETAKKLQSSFYNSKLIRLRVQNAIAILSLAQDSSTSRNKL
jgi:UPF0755 protein